MISMPDDLLERVDREAARRNTTRSGFLQDAAARELGRRTPEEIEAALAMGRAALAHAQPFDPAEEVRASRDARDARDRRL